MKTLIKILCLSMLWFSCEGDVHGCLDSQACNYNSDANIDNNSCEYPESNFNCDGNCTVEIDCFDECGGAAELDDCGLCNGGGTDIDNDGICDDQDDCIDVDQNGECDGLIYGCTDDEACNYNDFADEDDESCEYSLENYDCDGNYIPFVSDLVVTGNFIIDIINLEENHSLQFSVYPIDEFTEQQLSGINIGFQIFDGPGYLSEGTLVSDSSGVEQTFNIVPLNHLDENGFFDFSQNTYIETYVLDNPTISDTVIVHYEEHGSWENIVLSDIMVENDSISMNQETLVSVMLTGTINGESDIPIQNKWIYFESLMPDDTDDTQTFGEMTPEYALTNEFGIAQSIFNPLGQTGFVKLKVSTENLTQETFMQVSSGEGITLELIIPSDNTLMVTGGGGNESVTISAEIKDGFGNYVSDEYDVIFSIPCPFPIDGPCPNGDGDFNNDIMLNGTPSEGGEPIVVSRSVNGIANVTLNSGNRPGLVAVKTELCSVDDIEGNSCSSVIYEAQRVAAAISAGPANYGQVASGWTEADSTGAGVYSLPITATFWDQWTNPIADSTSVYWYINPEYIASVDPESKIGNCGENEPGQACTQAYYTSGDTFNQGQICAKVAGEGGSDVIACDDHYNPCVDCQIEIIPLSPTVTDYCQTNDQPLDILVRGHLGDAYGDDVHLGSLLMEVFDATAFNFISSDDTTIDEDMGYEFDPPIPASATQITDSNGKVYWIVRLPNDNCHNTNPDDPDVFSCDNVFFRAFLLDPLYGESIDLNTTLFKNCQP